MLNSITNYTSSYTNQSLSNTAPKIPAALQKDADLDVYERADGTTATRLDKTTDSRAGDISPPAKAEKTNDQQFRDLLHQFIGQTLFGQMLKSMRATQEKNPYFHGGQAEEIYQSMLDMEFTDEMTKATSKTLSEPMYKLMTAPKTKV